MSEIALTDLDIDSKNAILIVEKTLSFSDFTVFYKKGLVNYESADYLPLLLLRSGFPRFVLSKRVLLNRDWPKNFLKTL